ncbi:hypothetical protein RDV89_16305 [Nocardioides zeae]|uniref:MmcQ/YjbR family DNA-binding protein n=1 Tax=Nocardioides imazamoxiresistens TaxID=3231893 RepID=A0ABU3PZU0_9ACTN|nr:hypothetical protein [Nocardioides zeae]MDT9594649.1 hypothetical protein [Nocardioides zeae]
MADDPGRSATPEDVDVLCGELPHTELGTSWGDMPTWLVSDPATKAAPKGFCAYRRPHATAVDPTTGEPFVDLVLLWAADRGAKAALVDADGPFFSVPHLDGGDTYLVQASRLGEVSLGELRELVTESWLRVAPPKLARALAAEDGTPRA